jgi:hypothetical protein
MDRLEERFMAEWENPTPSDLLTIKPKAFDFFERYYVSEAAPRIKILFSNPINDSYVSFFCTQFGSMKDKPNFTKLLLELFSIKRSKIKTSFKGAFIPNDFDGFRKELFKQFPEVSGCSLRFEYTFQPRVRFGGHNYEFYYGSAIFRDGKYLGSYFGGDYKDQRSDQIILSNGEAIILPGLPKGTFYNKYSEYFWERSVDSKFLSILNSLKK